MLKPRHSRLIALVEDNSDVAGTMMIALERAGYHVRLFTDSFSALAGLSYLDPHAILLDIGLPGMDGYELATKLRKNPRFQQILFVGLSGFKRRETAESGQAFDHFFNKPVDIFALCQVLERAEKLRVLLIDDHAELTAATAALLRNEGLEVQTALSAREGLEAAQNFIPQLTLCDLNLPDMSGREVISALRANPLTRQTHAVVLTAMSSQELRHFNSAASEMGIDEFISKPLTPEIIRMLMTRVRTKEKV